MSRVLIRACLFAMSFLVSALPVAAQYSIQELPTLSGGQFSEAAAINERGQIVGRSDTASNDEPDFHAVLWENGIVTDLGTLPGGRYSWATDINNKGQIVGVSQTTSSCERGPFSACEHAFLWEDGTMLDLGAIGGPFSWATAINERGQIVGFSTTSIDGPGHAVLWDQGALIDLGALPGDDSSIAMGINNNGEIVGWSASTTTRAFLWARGAISELAPLPGGTFGLANGINNRGQVVGVGDDAGGRPPVLWTKGVPAILQTPQGAVFGQATGISNSGDSVGAVTYADENTFAVVWRKGTVAQLPIVPAPENMGSFTIANDINSPGAIVGQSQGRAVVWLRTPQRRR
jgi:probable HAF family extracellular repeat protein